jgi:hypothetical protein
MSDRRNKTLAVLMAAVMVVGFVGVFAGGAAAQSSPDASINATPADEGTSGAQLVSTIEVSKIGTTPTLGSGGSNQFEINFQNAGSGDIDFTGTAPDASDINIDLVGSDGSVESIAPSDLTTNTNTDSGQLQVEYTGADVDLTDIDGDGSDLQFVRIHVSDGSSGVSFGSNLDQSTRTATVSLSITTGENINVQSDAVLPLGSNAPIQLDDGTSHSSLRAALQDADLSSVDQVTVSGDVDEFRSQPAALDASNDAILQTISVDDTVDVVGQNNPTILVPPTNGNNFIDINGNSDVKFTGLAFDSSVGELEGTEATAAIGASSNANNANISSNSFDSFTNTNADILDLATLGTNGITVSNNDFGANNNANRVINIGSSSSIAGDVTVTQNTVDPNADLTGA